MPDVLLVNPNTNAEATRDLRPRFSVPIIEPVPAAIRRVAALLDSGQTL